MYNKINLTFFVLSSLTLVACGGSDDPEFEPTSEVQVTVDNGQFKNSSDTDVYFGANFGTLFSDERAFGRNASHCYSDANSYYFETENTLVFGSSTLPESDFRTVASWVESEIDSAADAFDGMSFTAILEKRNNIAPEATAAINSWMTAGIDAVEYPTNFDGMNRNEQGAWFSLYFRSQNIQKQNEIIEEVGEKIGVNWQANQYRLADKLLVCLHEGTDQFNYGEGTRFGVNVAAPSINTPSGAVSIIKHELVHTFQGMLYDSSYSAFLLPKWFSEGQAVYMSGQDIASTDDSSDYHATHFVNYQDESGFDPGELYKHYGLAYKYLNDANNAAAMTKVITGMNDSQFNSASFSYSSNIVIGDVIDYDFSDGYSSHTLPFIDSFDNAGLVDSNGAKLDLRRYKRDYDILIK
jgi:hypothetical protein